MKNKYVSNLVKDFEQKYPLYEEFCFAMNKIITDLLEQKKYKYQIYYRVKSIERLREKIIRKKKRRKIYKSIYEIDDLAGVRVVFYLESDKEKFTKDLIKAKLNTVCIEDLEKKNGYRARHVIVSMNKKNLEKYEFQKYENLRCEIQLVSIFSHAWSELEHDWLYKDVYGLRNKSPEAFKTAKKQMESIFKNYVRKLNMRFERVAKQILGYKKIK